VQVVIQQHWRVVCAVEVARNLGASRRLESNGHRRRRGVERGVANSVEPSTGQLGGEGVSAFEELYLGVPCEYSRKGMGKAGEGTSKGAITVQCSGTAGNIVDIGISCSAGV